jgi:MFS family permease
MPVWKRNLFVCWCGMFLTGIGMSQIAPILPLYLRHLGVDDTRLVEQLSGLAFGVTFIVSAVFSPVWGVAADRYGRKPMLIRASLGMAIVIFAMGFSVNVPMFLGLRLLQGVITGYATACIILVATETEQKHVSWALGVLSTSNTSGSLLGPLLGGWVGETFGLRNVFFLTGAAMFLAFLATAFFVKEDFIRKEQKVASSLAVWRSVPEKALTVTLFVTFFILTIALTSIEPILTVFITELSKGSNHVALWAGIVFSSAGLATIIAAPLLGRLSDKLGPATLMPFGLAAAAVLFVGQAFVSQLWELVVLRFAAGLALAGIVPSINALIKQVTPAELTGRIYGINNSAQYLGVFAGATLGGQIASALGLRSVFLATSALLLLAAVWVYWLVFRRRGTFETPA